MSISQIPIETRTDSYLTDEPRNEQEDQDAVVIAAMTEEGVGHEGGEEGHLSVSLSHFHFPQLHLDGLRTQVPRCKTG